MAALSNIASTDSGSRFLQLGLNKLEFGGLTQKQADTLNAEGLGKTQFKAGQNAALSMQYNPDNPSKPFSLTNASLSSGIRSTNSDYQKDTSGRTVEDFDNRIKDHSNKTDTSKTNVSGSSNTVLNRDVNESGGSFWVHHFDPKSGQYETSQFTGQYERTGNVITMPNARQTTASGKTYNDPQKVTLFLGGSAGSNPAQAFEAAKINKDNALHASKAQFALPEDKKTVDGGFTYQGGQTATQMLEKAHQNLGTQKGESAANILFDGSKQNQIASADEIYKDLNGLIKNTTGTSIRDNNELNARLQASWGSDKQVLGWIGEKLSGASVGAQASLSHALTRSAQDSTETNLIQAAFRNIAEGEGTPEEKAEASYLLKNTLEERAMNNYGGDFDMSRVRTLTASSNPGDSTGKSLTPHEIGEFARHKPTPEERERLITSTAKSRMGVPSDKNH